MGKRVKSYLVIYLMKKEEKAKRTKRTKRKQFNFKPIGKSIKKNRKILDLTQDDVAQAIKVQLPYYSKIENNGQHPSLQLFYEIVRVLKLSVDEHFLPEKKTVRTSKRRAIDDLLDGLSDKELEIIAGTINGIIQSKKE